MNEKRLLTFVVLAMILAGCGTSGAATQPSDAGQPPATSTAQSPGDLSPLEWLSVAAFETAQDGLPDVLPAYSPEGFNALDPDHVSAEAPNGYVLHQSRVVFQLPIDGQVYTEDQVTVELYSYDVLEGRTDHLNRIAAQAYAWHYFELNGQRILRYYSSGVDGRVWISGPYLIVLYSGLDTSATSPWVDAFASLYLVMFPPN